MYLCTVFQTLIVKHTRENLGYDIRPKENRDASI